MSLETIEKYRKAYDMPTGYPWVERMIEEIEREVDEGYMRLPRDKDGEPIHVGDVVAIDNGLTAGCRIEADRAEVYGVKDGMILYVDDSTVWQAYAGWCRHAKRHTVEDVIYDIAINSVEVARVVDGVPVLGINMEQLQEEIELNADKLREAVTAG